MMKKDVFKQKLFKQVDNAIEDIIAGKYYAKFIDCGTEELALAVCEYGDRCIPDSTIGKSICVARDYFNESEIWICVDSAVSFLIQKMYRLPPHQKDILKGILSGKSNEELNKDFDLLEEYSEYPDDVDKVVMGVAYSQFCERHGVENNFVFKDEVDKMLNGEIGEE